MSQDYEVICHKCKKVRHFGQSMACINSLGFGSKDTEGQKDVVDWIFYHLSECNQVPQGQSQPFHRLEIRHCDDTKGVEDYDYVHDEKVPHDYP